MTSFGRKAAELVKEVAVTDSSALAPYNEQLVSQVKEEANEHYRALLAQLSSIHGAQGGADAASPEAAANVMVHNRALLRNKRLLLAYVNARMARIKALRWTVGSGLPAEISASLSASESDFFKAYSRLLGSYTGRTGVNLNLMLDPSPPKQQKVEVRVLVDFGSFWTRDGEVLLAARSTHLLWRDEAQPLIAEGVLEKVSDE